MMYGTPGGMRVRVWSGVVRYLALGRLTRMACGCRETDESDMVRMLSQTEKFFNNR